MADLSVNIRSEVDKAVADMQKFRTELAAAQSVHTSSTAAVAAHSASLGQLTRDVENGTKGLEGLAQHIEYVAGGFTNLRAILFGGALTYGFATLINGATEFDLAAEKMARTLNGNAIAGSAWAAIAKTLGIDADQLGVSFGHLSGLIEKQNPVLNQLGIAYHDSQGNLLSLDQVIGESADWFQKHAGASNEAAVATELFGRNGQQLIPVLEEGSAGIANLKQEMADMGYVMDSKTLQQNAAFARSLEEAKTAVSGLFVELGNALLPGIAALAQGLADNKPIIDAFAGAIQRAESFVIGFIEALTGKQIVIKQSSLDLSNLADKVAAYGKQSDLAQGSTKASTQALDDQIAALQAQQTAIDRVLDSQIKQLQQEQAQASFDDKIAASKQKQSDDDQRIADDQRRYQTDLLSGNLTDLQGALDDEAAAKADQASLDQTIAKDTADYQRQQAIQSLQDQKAARDQDFQDQIKALQDMKTKIGQAASDSVAAVSDAFSAMGGIGDKGGTDASKGLSNSFITDQASADLGGKFGDQLKKDIHNYDFKAIGDDIGNALLAGIGDAIQTNLEKNKLYDVAKLIQDIATGNASAWGHDLSALFSGISLPPGFGSFSGGGSPTGAPSFVPGGPNDPNSGPGAATGVIGASGRYDPAVAYLAAIARNTTQAPAVGIAAQVSYLNGLASSARMRGFNTTSV